MRSGGSGPSPSSSGLAISSAPAMMSASGGRSAMPATPRSARTRRRTFAAASRSPGRVANSSSPAAMFADSAAKNPPPDAALGVVPCAAGAEAGARRVSSAVRSIARCSSAGDHDRASRRRILRSSTVAVSVPASAGDQDSPPPRSARPTRSSALARSANGVSFAIVALPRSARA